MIGSAHSPEDVRFARQQSRYSGKLVPSEPVSSLWNEWRQYVFAGVGIGLLLIVVL